MPDIKKTRVNLELDFFVGGVVGSSFLQDLTDQP